MYTCPKCGSKVERTDDICPKCNTTLNWFLSAERPVTIRSKLQINPPKIAGIDLDRMAIEKLYAQLRPKIQGAWNLKHTIKNGIEYYDADLMIIPVRRIKK